MNLDPIVNGIPILFIIFGLVEFSKKFGWEGNHLTLLSMFLGVVLGISYQVAQQYPEFARWFFVVIYGLALGLSASGLYDYTKKFMPRSE